MIPDAEVHGKGETLLFVDDEVKQLRLMQQFLEECGYKVLVAEDGRQAVDVYRQHSAEISLVVLDLGLPHMSGSEALKAMQETSPDLKAIVATAYLPSEAEGARWRAIIMKPYRLEDVLQQIARVLDEP
jgi:DNA-binding NtrC family response regulator